MCGGIQCLRIIKLNDTSRWVCFHVECWTIHTQYCLIKLSYCMKDAIQNMSTLAKFRKWHIMEYKWFLLIVMNQMGSILIIFCSEWCYLLEQFCGFSNLELWVEEVGLHAMVICSPLLKFAVSSTNTVRALITIGTIPYLSHGLISWPWVKLSF